MKLKKGFTLVELIIVISILSILSTLAFISVRPYFWHSRNTLRIDTVGKLALKIDSYLAMEKPVIALSGTGQEVQGSSIAGSGVTQNLYRAGIPNYRALDLTQSAFQDPQTGDNYPLGVTSKVGQKYSIGFILESDDSYYARVEGTWSPRFTSPISGIGEAGTKMFEIQKPGDVHKLYIGDTVTGSGVALGTEVQKISRDGLHITLSKNFLTNASSLQLVQEEVLGLIASEVDNTQPVLDYTSKVPYLKN